MKSSVWVDSFLQVAIKASEAADDRAATLATKRFAEWLTTGPAEGLKRQHLFSRAATGWTSEKVGEQPETNLSELDDLEGLSAEQLRVAFSPTTSTDSPLGAQFLANSEKNDWAKQWAEMAEHDKLEWPDETEPLSPMSVKIFRQALFSFAASTGLGWDGVHPRALLRLPDDVLAQ